MRQRFAIITGWTIIILAFCVFISNAFPPTPPTSIGTLATQNADNVSVTNITVGGVANVGTLAANVIKTDTSADATLSGTPIIITVYDAASNTPYYFKAYPVK